MKQAILIQTVACCSGLAGVYLTDSPQFKWVLAGLIVLSTIAAIFVAWSERQDKAFVQRALESLVASVKPNDFARKRVFSAINSAAAKKDMPITQMLGFSAELTKLRFFREEQAEMGVLLIDDEKLARLSVLTDKELEKSAGLLFKEKNEITDRSFNDVVDTISAGVRVMLWEKQIDTPKWCIWSDNDGVSAPTTPPDESCSKENRVHFTKKEVENMKKSSSFALDTLIQERARMKLEH